jgi:N-acetylglucosaminyl-diphospho-decaprenol L-rhamnosyltransferase
MRRMPSTTETFDAAPRKRFQIGVVIVAYASGVLLRECIAGVLMDAMVTTVVVVDNSSDMQSKDVVTDLAVMDARLRYIDPHVNLGFAAGCNAGVSELREWTHVFFVNPDVTLSRPLSSLLEYLDASDQVIVAGRLCSPRNASGINARPIVSLRRELKKAFLGGRVYKQSWGVRLAMEIDKPYVVGQVDGALLGMSAETYSLLSGFDQQFELYYDDVDICARAKAFGGCLFVPEAWGTHVGGASSSKVSGLAYCLRTISRARYFRKHFGRSKATNLMILVVAVAEFITRTLTCQSEGSRARVCSVKLQLREVIWPGSVVLLPK